MILRIAELKKFGKRKGFRKPRSVHRSAQTET
nr:MAG TPA: hypothetical protein [Caudoviricetes sp.]